MRYSKYLCPNCLKSFKGPFGRYDHICASCGSETILIHYSVRVPKVSANKATWKKFVKRFFYHIKNERNREKILFLYKKFNIIKGL